jgi:Mn2+/Fe2+ NRAMP family transporter
MLIHLAAIVVTSFTAGMLTTQCLHDHQDLVIALETHQLAQIAWRRFILLMVAVGMVASIAGTMMRMEVEKTKARIDEVKKLETVLERK